MRSARGRFRESHRRAKCGEASRLSVANGGVLVPLGSGGQRSDKVAMMVIEPQSKEADSYSVFANHSLPHGVTRLKISGTAVSPCTCRT